MLMLGNKYNERKRGRMSTKEETMNLYEGMYIINTTLSEDAREKALEKILEGVTSRGGEIKKTHDQGRKKLAYEIDGRRDGFYYLIYFAVRPSAIAEMWKEYHLHEDLIRFMTICCERVLEEITFKQLEE